MILEILCFPHTIRLCQMAIPSHCSRNPPKDPSGKIVHRASEPSPSNRWGAITLKQERTAIPGQTIRLNNGTLNPSEDRSRVTRAQRRTRT
jgi:hypothetical protein